MDEPQHEAGWYDNPEGEGERWWTGQEWTDRTRGSKSRTDATKVLAIVAVVMFLVGGFMAIGGLGWMSFGFAALTLAWLLQ